MRLEITNLTKHFGAHRVIDVPAFTAEFARCLALVGPSGGGKSTLLRLIGGLETPDTGTIRVENEPLPAEETRRREYRRRIGFVFQGLNLFPHLTALENVTLPLTQIHRIPPGEADSRARGVLRRFGLEAHVHKKPGQLSGGQRQRVAIARAIAIQPRFLLLDEPTSALDPEMTVEVLETLEELREQGVAFILVTHEMGFARRAADRVAFVENGRIACCEPAAAFFERSESEKVRRFLAKTLKFA
ncbi:MAG TPA: amino acid ABC transporter ATP-binding protein [Chthoniobacterales bacterium]